LGVFASLFFFEPWLANPWVIFARLNNDEIPAANLALRVFFVPILFRKTVGGDQACVVDFLARLG
jgi:hypothetical protein